MLHAQQIAPGLVNAVDHSWPEPGEHQWLQVQSPKGVWFFFRLQGGTLLFSHAIGTNGRFNWQARNRAERLLCRLAGLDDCARGDEDFAPDHRFRKGVQPVNSGGSPFDRRYKGPIFDDCN